MLQKDFKEKIAAIRAICLSFAQGPLHQSISVGDASSTSAFKKYSTLLKVCCSSSFLEYVMDRVFRYCSVINMGCYFSSDCRKRHS